LVGRSVVSVCLSLSLSTCPCTTFSSFALDTSGKLTWTLTNRGWKTSFH
jgi:hypothetical protein